MRQWSDVSKGDGEFILENDEGMDVRMQSIVCAPSPRQSGIRVTRSISGQIVLTTMKAPVELSDEYS